MLFLQAFVDLVALGVAFVVGRLTRHAWDGRPLDLLAFDASTQLFALSALFCIALLLVGQRYHVRRRPFWDELRGIINAIAVAAAVNAILTLVTKQYSPVTQYLAAWSSAMLAIPLARYGLRRWLLARGAWQRPTVIIGSGRCALEAYRALAGEPLMGFHVVAFASPPSEHADISRQVLDLGVPIEPESLWPIERMMRHQVVIALEPDASAAQGELMSRLSRAGHRDVFLAPPMRGLALYGMEISHFFRHELLLMSVRNNLARKGPRLVKRAFDIVASSALLGILAPLLLWIALRIRRTGSPVLFLHPRVGRNGRTFSCLKFSTMVPDADRRLERLLEACGGHGFSDSRIS
jgi:undecaprenyl-phosphate galactose phosphotransferase